MGEQAVREVVLTLVGQRVRVDRAPEEADPKDVVACAVAVLTVIEEGDTVAGLGEVREAVCSSGCFPGGVAIGGTPYGAVHRLEGRFVRAHGQREECPQEDLPLVPLDVRLDVHTPGAGWKPVGL